MKDDRILHDLRERLSEISRDVPDRPLIEAGVRELTADSTRPTGFRLWAGAAVLLCVVAGLIALVGDDGARVEAGPGGSNGIVAVEERSPTVPTGRRFVTDSFRLPLAFVMPELDDGEWVVEGQSERLLSLALVDNGAPREFESMLRLAVVDSPAELDEVAVDLQRNSFDTDVVEDRTTEFGGFAGRRLVLTSRGGTNEVGFRLGEGVYVRTSGIDRSYFVHLVQTRDALLVIWLDAETEEFEETLAEAERLVASIRLGS